MRADIGQAATCLLAALGTENHETDPEYVRAQLGALLLAEGLHDLRLLREMVAGLIKGLSKG